MSQFIAIDTAKLPWEESFDEKVGRALFRKELFSDPETGMMVRLVRYPAGVINPRTRTPAATACTCSRAGSSRIAARTARAALSGFPKVKRWNTAPGADADCTVVFITNKPFRIAYVT